MYSSAQRLKAKPQQAELFRQPLPAGLVYAKDVLTPAEEADLVAEIAKLPFKPFDFHGYLGHRRIVSFGWRYDYGERHIAKSDPLPEFLISLRKSAGRIAAADPDEFEHALVTEYAPGAGIGWHRDKPEFKDVVAFSFRSPCILRFRRKTESGWERVKIEVSPRSAYLLRGEARHAWQHSIPPLAELRYSVTFRNMAERSTTRRTRE